MEGKLRDLLVGAGMGSIVMPHNQFVKEHKNLLGVLKRGKRSELDAEYADQAKELEEHGGSKASSGFIRRMLGEVKKVHNGAYKPITKLAKDSTMNSPRVFNYSKVPKPSNWLQTKFGKAKAPPAPPAPAMKKPDMALYGKYHSALLSGKNKESVAQFEKMYHDWLLANDKPYRDKHEASDANKQYKAREAQKHKEARYIQPFRKTIENIKYYSQPENWKRMNTKERQSFYSDIDGLNYIAEQAPEVGKNPYPNADSLPYVEMRRAYKMWQNKKAKK